MHSRNLRQPLVAIAMMVMALSARADYQTADGNFQLSGFGTLGVVKTDTNDAQFTYEGKPKGASKKLSADVDSKLAVQGTYKFTPSISGTTQIMTKYSGDGAYESDFEWAFLKWQAMPGLSIRAGRTGAPLFMISDFRDVGYANTFVRPPADVYDQVPFSTVDGGDINLQKTYGPVTLTGQLWGGNTKATYSGTTVEVNRMRGLNLIAEVDGGYTIRVGRVQGKLTYTSQGLTDLTNGALLAQQLLGAFPSAASAAGSAADVASVQDADASFSGVGLGVDQENWVGALEYTKRKTKSVIPDTTGWYAMLGYRFGLYTPYAIASQLKVDRLATNPLTPDLDAFGLGDLRAGLDQVITSTNEGQKTTSIGLRWDGVRNLAVKAQWDRIKTDGGVGLFNNAGGSIVQGKRVNVLSFVLDFVF